MQYHFTSVAKSNSAAWLVRDGFRPLQVESAACNSPEGDSGLVLVKVRAVAVNNLDVTAQVTGSVFPRSVKYPLAFYGQKGLRSNKTRKSSRILGCDLAGEVVQIRKPVIGGFRVGDRILGLALGGIAPWESLNSDGQAAFQEYALVHINLALKIPDTITYEQACVLPLSMTTAAFALFHENYLCLSPPTFPPREPDASSDVVIITDGISSEGCFTIQLASTAGYWVYSTAPPEYFETVKELGARRVFDSHSCNLADDILSALREDRRTVAGAVAVGIKTVDTCTRVLNKYKGGNGLRDNNRFIALIDLPADLKVQSNPIGMAHTVGSTALKMSTLIRSKVTKVPMKFVMIHTLNYSIVRMVFHDFVPRALASGHLVFAPRPRVVGTGLAKIQEAFDVHRDGVAAGKVVVSIQ